MYREVDRKVYIPVYVRNHRVIACTDTGSDVTLIQESLYNKILSTHKYETPSGLGSLKSFIRTSITIRGKLQSKVRTQRQCHRFSSTLSVLGNIYNIPTLLSGNYRLRLEKHLISYNDPLSDVTFPIPQNIKATVY